ncbi:MAG TPA: SDR family oxidoreductase [Capsulimonadaceae bacterium]|jgi:NAD(P)-dependent dehydrogenase (short-subunit alcohol dehydrogenase family)
MAKLGGKNTLMLAGGIAAGVAALRYVARSKRRFDLYGKVVLVTGGARGLGLLMAREFSNRGAKIAVCAKDAAELEDAKTDLRKRGANVFTYVCDMTNQSEVKELIAAVENHFGAVDVLVNNAGVMQVGPMDDMTIEDYETAMRVHYWAPLYASLEVVPGMRRRKSGRIVNVSSIGGMVSVPHLLPYSASKFALVGLSEGMRSELMGDNIYVTTVSPGLLRTGSTQTADFKGQNEDEYAWFALSDTLPGASMRADYAAWKIVEATIYGDAEIVLSIPARLVTIARALFPEPTSETLAFVNQALPGPGSMPSESAGENGEDAPITAPPAEQHGDLPAAKATQNGSRKRTH